MTRGWWLVPVALAVGCGSKETDKGGGAPAVDADVARNGATSPPRPAPITDEQLKLLHRRVQGAKDPVATTRPGLPPAQKSGDARDVYEAAAQVAGKTPDAADHPHDPAALSIADLVSQGASRPSSLSPLARGGDPVAYGKVGGVVLAVGYAELGAGKHVAAARRGLVVAALAQDLARDAGWAAADVALPLLRKGLTLARTAIAQAVKARPAELAPLRATCDALRAGAPSFALAATAELASRDRALVADGAPMVDVAARYEAARKGLVDGSAGEGPGRAVVERIEAARSADLPDAPLLRADLAADWTLAHGDLVGTCLVIALEEQKRTRGGVLPQALAELGKLVPELPPDPISGGAWEYVDDGLGGRVLRSGAVMKDGKAAAVELPVRGKPKT